MKLIKIDPRTCSIEWVETTATLPELYRLIGCQTIDVCARQANGDALTVDDEALLDEPQPPAFSFNGFGPIHGVGLLTSVDDEGETIEPSMTLAEATKHVRWLGHIHTKPFFAFVSLG